MLKYKKRFCRGFSIIELIVAITAFSVIMTAVVMTFSRLIQNYRQNKVMQKDIENAQYAFNLISKTIRSGFPSKCGDVICAAGPYSNLNKLRIYDFSQNQCHEYEIDTSSHTLIQRFSASPDPDFTAKDNKIWCAGLSPGTFGSEIKLIENVNSGSFYVVPSSASVAGRIMFKLKMCPQGNCSSSPNGISHIQTTVSLRNYRESNP